MARIVFYMFLVLFLSVGIDSRKSVGSGSRRTTSWGSSKPKPSTSTNTGFSHSNQDITRLSYGNHESAARSPPKSHDTHRPSAPSSDHKPSAPRAEDANINKNVGWNTNQQNPGTNQQPGNIGWNVNQPGQNQPGQTGNIGWNTNQRPGQNTPNQQTHVNNVNAAPPPYPGAPPGYPVHGQAPPGYPTHGQPPPPYPGFAPHGQNVGPPPAYSGYQTHGRYDPPPAYGAPGYGAPGNYPRQGYPGYNQGGYGGYGGGGYGGYPGGGGYGMPGSPGLLGGFGGGGYGSNRGGSGFSGGSLLTGALLGYTLSNLLSNNHNQHYYYPNSRTVYSDNSNTNSATSNTQVHTVSGDKGTYATYVGNMTCISMYNAKEVSKWANATLQDFYASYPSQPFPMNLNSTTGGMNFTVIPGEIIHKEKLDVTCCGTNRGPVDLVELTNGKIKDINCLYQTFEMPFRKLTFIPVNNTDTNNTTTAVPTTPLPTNVTTAVPSSTQEAQLTTNSTTETTINSEQTTVQS